MNLFALRLTVSAAVLSAVCVAQTAAQLATFENFPEGLRGISFTDPISGISFSNALIYQPGSSFSPVSTSFFTDSHSADANHPVGGNVLSNGFTPGGVFSYGYNFGFSMTLPRDTDRLSMDLYGRLSTLKIELYDSSNTLLSSANFSGVTGQVDAHFDLAHPTARIRNVKVIPTSGMYAAYDNINVPEPTVLGALFALGYLARRRRIG